MICCSSTSFGICEACHRISMLSFMLGRPSIPCVSGSIERRHSVRYSLETSVLRYSREWQRCKSLAYSSLQQRQHLPDRMPPHPRMQKLAGIHNKVTGVRM